MDTCSVRSISGYASVNWRSFDGALNLGLYRATATVIAPASMTVFMRADCGDPATNIDLGWTGVMATFRR